LLRVLWRLSYQDMTDWLQSWPALAFACGFAYDSQNRLVFLVHHSNANAVTQPVLRCLKVCFSSAYLSQFVVV
jgi:hypothetical protein